MVARCRAGCETQGARESNPMTCAGRQRALWPFYRRSQPRPGPARHERRGRAPASRSRLCPPPSRAPAPSGQRGVEANARILCPAKAGSLSGRTTHHRGAAPGPWLRIGGADRGCGALCSRRGPGGRRRQRGHSPGLVRLPHAPAASRRLSPLLAGACEPRRGCPSLLPLV